MKSSIYKCFVMHQRLAPKRNEFSYGMFMFLLDLDELSEIDKRFWLFKYGAFSLFSFYDKDHANFPGMELDLKTTKSKILSFIKSNKGESDRIKSVKLLTNLTTLGYVFNPISIYYCYDSEDALYCSVAEVCNTFGEMKLYYIDQVDGQPENNLSLRTIKHFYVSPFSELDIYFQFLVKRPNEKLVLRVDDYKQESLVFKSSLTGERYPLNDGTMLLMFMRFPLVTLRVITLIHWQALKLYCKRIPFFRKNENPTLQQKLVKL